MTKRFIFIRLKFQSFVIFLSKKMKVFPRFLVVLHIGTEIVGNGIDTRNQVNLKLGFKIPKPSSMGN